MATVLIGASLCAQSNYATPYLFTTLAGTAGTTGSADGIGSAARFSFPYGVAIFNDAAGGLNFATLYVADANNHTIRIINLEIDQILVRTLAGTAGQSGFVDGQGSAARFNNPSSVAVDTAGNVYVGDVQNHAIRKITRFGVVTTLAGGTAGGVDGTGSAARFLTPYGVATDTAGNVYVADTANSAIRKITPAGVVTTLAGSFNNPGSADGTGSAARFSNPFGMAVDPNGNVYVADRLNTKIRKITPAGVVTTLAGPATFSSGDADGTGSDARFAAPVGIAADANGNVYVVDSTNSTVRKITPGGVVTTLAGQTRFTGGTDGTGKDVRFNGPQGVAVDQFGNLYIADTSNNAIRMSVVPPIISPQPVSQVASPGAETFFFGGVTGSLLTLTKFAWRKDGAPAPFDDSHLLQTGVYPFSGVRIINTQAPDLGNYTLVATNVAGTTTSNVAAVSFAVSNAGRLGNLSIRTTAGTGAQTLIVGVVVGGAGTSGTKPLLVRSVGPALGNFGVPGFLVDPALTLFSRSTVVAANDNWNGDAQVAAVSGQVGAFALDASSRDAAIYSPSLSSGAYTVQITGVGGTTGVALAEIYDASPANTFFNSTPRLVNVSARTQVGTDANVLIAGFTIIGSTTRTLLIRAIGPTLGTFGVGGALADPKLELYSGNTLLQSNDDWGGTAGIAAASANVGAFGLDPASKDAVLLLTLQPGSYSAKVSGVGNTTGVALVEIYEMP